MFSAYPASAFRERAVGIPHEMRTLYHSQTYFGSPRYTGDGLGEWQVRSQIELDPSLSRACNAVNRGICLQPRIGTCNLGATSNAPPTKPPGADHARMLIHMPDACTLCILTRDAINTSMRTPTFSRQVYPLIGVDGVEMLYGTLLPYLCNKPVSCLDRPKHEQDWNPPMHGGDSSSAGCVLESVRAATRFITDSAPIAQDMQVRARCVARCIGLLCIRSGGSL